MGFQQQSVFTSHPQGREVQVQEAPLTVDLPLTRNNQVILTFEDDGRRDPMLERKDDSKLVFLSRRLPDGSFQFSWIPPGVYRILERPRAPRSPDDEQPVYVEEVNLKQGDKTLLLRVKP